MDLTERANREEASDRASTTLLVHFLVPLGMALFLLAMILAYDGQPGLIRLEAVGIFLLSVTGGWRMAQWMQVRTQSGRDQSKA